MVKIEYCVSVGKCLLQANDLSIAKKKQIRERAGEDLCSRNFVNKVKRPYLLALLLKGDVFCSNFLFRHLENQNLSDVIRKAFYIKVYKKRVLRNHTDLLLQERIWLKQEF